MHIGVFYFATAYSMPIVDLAIELEQRGFESLFQPEHTHIPVSRKTPFPSGGELPKEYKHTYDPFVSLGFAAAATKKLKVGTGICLLAQRDPIVTAKCVASLDQLSGGRFLFGIGGGWNVDEMENHGATYGNRFAKMRENVLAMKALWTEEEGEFHGEHVNFDKAWSYPKPTQRPHPPVLIGGETDHTLRRVVEFGNGWFPRPGRGGFDPVHAMARMRQMAAEYDRDPAELSMTVFRAPEDRKTLDSYNEAGIERALLRLPTEGRDSLLKLLDSYMPLLG